MAQVDFYTGEFGWCDWYCKKYWKITSDSSSMDRCNCYILFVFGKCNNNIAKQFSNEKDSNKIYAFSSIIIALISCIISTVTFVMQFLMQINTITTRNSEA